MIRQAEAKDFDEISAIRQSLLLDVPKLGSSEYVSEVEQNGFLVPIEITYDQFVEQLPNYIVNENQSIVTGFLRLDDSQEMSLDEIPTWLDPVMEDIYWQIPHANIGKIAVHPKAKQRGVATTMLAEAERLTRTRNIPYIFSFIACCQPPTNYPSIRFHEKHGFKETAPLAPLPAFGIEDYKATLYSKRLS